MSLTSYMIIWTKITWLCLITSSLFFKAWWHGRWNHMYSWWWLQSFRNGPNILKQIYRILKILTVSWSTQWILKTKKNSQDTYQPKKSYKCIDFFIIRNCFSDRETLAQCARTDLDKSFLPKPMTTTGWKGTP